MAYLPPVAVGLKLERLSLVETAAPEAGDVSVLDGAARTLAGAGLVARVVSVSPAHLVGGRKRVERDGLVAYEDAFSLWRDNAGAYHAGVEGRGNLGVRCGPCSLDQSITFLLRQYGTPTSDRR